MMRTFQMRLVNGYDSFTTVQVQPLTHHYAYSVQFDWLKKKVLHVDKFHEQESRNYIPIMHNSVNKNKILMTKMEL